MRYRYIWIPKEWRHADVINLLKPGKSETSSQNYRPISLPCTTYKLLEPIFLTQIELRNKYSKQDITQATGKISKEPQHC